MHTEIQPIIVFPVRSNQIRFISIRLTEYNTETLAKIKNLWERLYPNNQFSQYAMKQSLGDFYNEEQSTGQVALIFSFFAIFIACMGLYSLLALTTIYRTKEIGIRKVLGAGTKELVILLTKEIFRLITLAGIIALPISFLLSYYWLDRFAYHVSLSLANYVFVFAAVFLVAVFTIYRQLWRTINSDSGVSLRSE